MLACLRFLVVLWFGHHGCIDIELNRNGSKSRQRHDRNGRGKDLGPYTVPGPVV